MFILVCSTSLIFRLLVTRSTSLRIASKDNSVRISTSPAEESRPLRCDETQLFLDIVVLVEFWEMLGKWTVCSVFEESKEMTLCLTEAWPYLLYLVVVV